MLNKIIFIGGGNIAEAILKGLAGSGLGAGYQSENIRVSDPSKDVRDKLRNLYGVVTESDNKLAVSWGDIIILAVKPDAVDSICREIAGSIDGRLLVSVAAGIRSNAILDLLNPETRVIRVMPNTPALVGEGMSALALAGGATADDLEIVKKIFETVGKTVVVPERQMDAVTGLSGSGPAYVFLMIEALADGGVKSGLSRDNARLLATQTVLGVARMVLETGLHPGVLKDKVASPGGTTIEGLHVLEKAGLRGILMDAVSAAAEKSKTLGGK